MKDNDLALIWLSKEIEHAADKGCVIKVEDAWDRYIVLAEDAGITIPSSFFSRPATFKEKLTSIVGHIMECVKSLEKGPSERHTLLIPKKYAKLALSQLVHQTAQANDEEDDKLTLPVYKQQDDIFLSIVHVALKIRSDLRDTPGYTGLDIGEHDADNCVPESLQLFLNLLFGGEQLLDGETMAEKENEIRTKTLSVGQDIVYGVTNGRKWTPKHIGLGSTLHQVTRSKDLVKLFHKAGHILSYDQILQVDTGLAESVLNTLDEETGAVIPPNLVQGSFVHFSADNIDILDETMDGKNTFYATQVATWQRGARMSLLNDLHPSKERTLKVPQSMDKIDSVVVRKSNPPFIRAVKTTWYDPAQNDEEHREAARATDLAFNMLRHQGVTKNGWTGFNQSLSRGEDQQVTKVGYIPIIQAPAHEMDTLNTVVKKCMHVATALGQRHTVITVDQALYCKLVELKWSVPEYQDKLVVQLGGLHVSMCFLRTIGDHI